MTTSVARQPIVRANGKIFGYELLYRKTPFQNFLLDDPDQATSDVAFNSFLDVGLDIITDYNSAFINFTRNSLLQRVPLLLPAEKVIVEILEDIEGSPEMVDIVKELKEKGYRIALDDFVLSRENAALLPHADIVKVDWRQSTSADIQKIIEARRGLNFELLAEKLETPVEFKQAASMGFTLFQGYYFGRPVVVT
ncbi:EAL and HDOD domain-containing protein [Salibacterium aidingense]|uniref:EAL and HDOD domain-containing protein n=1 Tax=Salibacterium aidingense TaxID=384933 RepID=UPI003BEDC636